MEHVYILQNFFAAIHDDPRIGTNHISLYTALFQMWSKQEYRCPVQVFSRELMPLCKIFGTATFHRSIRELHEYGYIRYVPSFDHGMGSSVFFGTESYTMIAH